ncbi:alpha/beta fold hydrolase [Sutcliffiella horikoshii]|uniref:alpha/beta fold hydrolase n=1 Tax=Sutcliffiella horikoshii TaxID=79883 RepID=UPI001F3CBB96|nr:alpha/beta hydrolase [Sutcliffiella horikoshii]MCG1023261.1 alpha/beta hydrolase [Sutcliffiella horikoshii]
MLLYTEIFGDGEPIVFLHTGLQTGMTDFEEQREYFKSRYKVVLPDLRGHGKSTSRDLSDYYEESANDLKETLDHLEVGSAHIVGCSIGALVALFLAKRFPEKVKTLTLSGIMPEKPANWSKIHQNMVGQQNALLENEQIRVYFDQLHGDGWEEFIYLAAKEDSYPFEETGKLDGLKMPTLFMVGEENGNEAKGAVIIPRLNNQIHLSVIPFAGHLVHSEQPEVYNQVLNGFLEKYCVIGVN